jgi:hypothetical protein
MNSVEIIFVKRCESGYVLLRKGDAWDFQEEWSLIK